MKIVAFGHRREVGKDTAAAFLATHLRTTRKNINVRKLGFASKLKEVAHSIYAWAGLKEEEYYEQHWKEKEIVLPKIGKSPRTVWIELGNYLRNIYEDTWLKYIFNGIKCDFLLLKDLRYPNEAEAVQAAGGLVVRVDNDNVVKHNDIADSALLGWNKWDATIDNSESMKELNKRVVAFADLFLPGVS